ncbi:MAG: protein YgfX [Methylococcales bacterium]
MSEPSGLWLRIAPDPSRLYLRFLIAAHLLALIGGLTAALPRPVQLVLVLSIVGSWIFQLRGMRLDRNENRPWIVYGEQDGWSFRIGSGEPVWAELLASSVATRWITILHFKTQKNRFQSFAILPDSLDTENYRKLQMILKISEKKL